MLLERLRIWIPVLSVSALAAGVRAQTEGEAVLLGGVWQASLSGLTQAADGTVTKFKTKVNLPIVDYGSESLGIGSIPLPGGDAIPGMGGTRLARSFSAKAEGVVLAATVKKNAQTGEGTSFKGTGIVTSSGEVTVFKISGKRVPGTLAPAEIPLFLEDFDVGLGPYTETNLAGAPADTLWHSERFCAPGTAIPASLGTTAAAYNQGDEDPPLYTFQTGATNSGALQGPAVAAPSGVPGLSVSFDILRDTESSTFFDRCHFQVSPAECISWTDVLQVFDEIGCAGTPITVTIEGNAALDAMAGKSFLHRFRFDTIDGVGNDYIGWYVDNVRIEASNP